MIAGLGAVAAAGALSGRTARAQGASAPAPFAPALHAEDDWMSAMRGRHRIVLDVTSADGVPDAIRFTGNLFTGHKTGYDVDEADVAIVMCLRHGATGYGYGDAFWAKYGRIIAPNAAPVPTANPYALAPLARRGVQFMVCGTASRGLAGRIAGQGGDAEAVLTEMRANLLPSARIVAAGVVGVVHAQERGFSLIYVG